MRETGFNSVTNEGCRMKGNGYCPRPLENAAAFLSKKWTSSIIVIVGNFGILRFNDLLRRVDGLTRKTLSERLRELEKYGIVVRKAYAEKPPRVEYSLTPKGKKVRNAVLPLLKLAESNTFKKQ